MDICDKVRHKIDESVLKTISSWLKKEISLHLFNLIEIVPKSSSHCILLILKKSGGGAH